MSSTLSPTETLFRQRILACSGFYAGKLDGRWGPLTEKADQTAQAEYKRIQAFGGICDPRSETCIITLLPKAQIKAREFMRVAGAVPGTVCKILSGTRTYAEQDRLFAQRPVVTRARGGQSNHNFGLAWDVGIFQNGHYLIGATHSEEAAYSSLAARIMSHVNGLEWGGNWKSIVDMPHYQLATGKTLSQIRAAFESGKPFV
jgi:peptidoglycan L-alanyl-D-glutamate endopeptidase CwlK